MPKTLHDARFRRKAVAHLREADPTLGALIERVGHFSFSPRVEGTHFDALCRSIIYQQISGKAAATIHGRFLGIYGNQSPAPSDLLETPEAELRTAGVSRQKVSYLRDLAERVEAGEVPLDRVEALDDDAIIASLVRIKGIGRWSAHMFLMFRLGRPDIMPDLDLGIQKGLQRLLDLEALPTPRVVADAGEAWRPYRTVAAWYLWRSLDTPTTV
jgi:3-methyladenine DNA glycosylase/8-oxoguanine DNA glycosylase